MKNKLNIAFAVFIILAAIYSASYITDSILKLPGEPRFFDIFLYWIHYSHIPHVLPKLIVGTLPACLVLLLLLLLIPKTKEPLYGDARFANDQEIKKMGLYAKHGIVLGKYNGRFLIDESSNHSMVTAPTRSGKGIGIVIPTLLQWPGSTIVLDIKFENFDITSHFRKTHGQDVYLFAPGRTRTHCWNPLDLIDPNDPNYFMTMQSIAEILCPDREKSDTPMWTSEARNIFCAAVQVHLDLNMPLTLANINQWIKLHTDPDTLEDFLNKHSSQISDQPMADLVAYMNYGDPQRGGVQGTITSTMTVFNNPLVNAATSKSDFNIQDMRRKPTTIYLGATPESMMTLASIYNLFFQFTSVIFTRNRPDKDEPYQVLLLMDEFTAMGKMNMIKKGIAYFAGVGIRLMIIIQGKAQLESVYDKSGADEFYANIKHQVVFAPNIQDDAEAVSKAIGNKTVKNRSRSLPSIFSNNADSSYNESDHSRALMLPEEVKRLGEDKCIIFVEKERPILAKKIQYYKEKAFNNRYFDTHDKKATAHLAPHEVPELPLAALDRTETLDHKNKKTDFGGSIDLTQQPDPVAIDADTIKKQLSPDQINDLVNRVFDENVDVTKYLDDSEINDQIKKDISPDIAA